MKPLPFRLIECLSNAFVKNFPGTHGFVDARFAPDRRHLGPR